MYSVRSDKDSDGYVFRVQPIEDALEMVSIDSVPRIMAAVEAISPGHACQCAWDKAIRMRDEQRALLEQPK